MKCTINNRETGELFERAYSLEYAAAMVAEMIKEDIDEGIYEPDYYEIVDADGNIYDERGYKLTK